jgi:hypothetical protein
VFIEQELAGSRSSGHGVVATWNIRSENSYIEDDLTRLLAEEEEVWVKSEGINPLSRTCNSHIFMKE